MEKADAMPRHKPFVYPYGFGWRKNLADFFAMNRTGDGVRWNTLPGTAPDRATDGLKG